MSQPIDYTDPAHDRRRLHRLRELVRGSADAARVLEQLLEALEQMPSPPAQSITAKAPEAVPLHERVSLALQRCQKALLAQSAVLWRWTPKYNALSLVASDGVPPEKLEAFRYFLPRTGHPIFHACRSSQPQVLKVPLFLRPGAQQDVTLPPYGVYIPVLAYGKSVGVLLLGGSEPLVPVPSASLSEIGRALGALLSLHPV